MANRTVTCLKFKMAACGRFALSGYFFHFPIFLFLIFLWALPQWRIQDLPKGGGADHGERAEREPKRGSGSGAPNGVQEQSPWWGVRGRSRLKLKAFCTFLYKKLAKS